MNLNSIVKNKDDLTIETIIHSFEEYALSDIKINIDRVAAGFILSVCFIDQLSGFIYNTDKVKKRFIKFLKEYMPQYDTMGIYESLRDKLVHNYSIGKYYRITNDSRHNYDSSTWNTPGMIGLQVFVNDIEIAFKQVRNNLRTQGQTRINAIAWAEKGYDVLRNTTFNFITCDENEATLLIDYYSSLIVGKTIDINEKLIAKSIIKKEIRPNQFTIHVLVGKENKNVDNTIFIEDAVANLCLKQPMLVLQELTPKQ